jgi:hypothetical protein
MFSELTNSTGKRKLLITVVNRKTLSEITFYELREGKIKRIKIKVRTKHEKKKIKVLFCSVLIFEKLLCRISHLLFLNLKSRETTFRLVNSISGGKRNFNITSEKVKSCHMMLEIRH